MLKSQMGLERHDSEKSGPYTFKSPDGLCMLNLLHRTGSQFSEGVVHPLSENQASLRSLELGTPNSLVAFLKIRSGFFL